MVTTKKKMRMIKTKGLKMCIFAILEEWEQLALQSIKILY